MCYTLHCRQLSGTTFYREKREERSDKDKIQFGLHFIISVALIYLTVVPAREPVVGAIIAMMEKIQDW